MCQQVGTGNVCTACEHGSIWEPRSRCYIRVLLFNIFSTSNNLHKGNRVVVWNDFSLLYIAANVMRKSIYELLIL